MAFPQNMSRRGQQEEEQGVPDTRTEAGREYMRKMANQVLLQSTVSRMNQQGNKEAAEDKLKIVTTKIHGVFEESFFDMMRLVRDPKTPVKSNGRKYHAKNKYEINELLGKIRDGFDSGFVSPSGGMPRNQGDTLLAQLMATPCDRKEPALSTSEKIRWDVAQTLLEYGARPDAVGDSGRSALHELSTRPDLNAKYLHAMLLKRPDVNGKDGQGKSPMDLAIESGNTSAIPMLRSAGARDDNVVKPFSHVAVQYLIDKKDEPNAEAKFVDMIKALHTNGYKLDEKNSHGENMDDLIRKSFEDKQFVDRILLSKKLILEKEEIKPRANGYRQSIKPSVSNTVVPESDHEVSRINDNFGKMPGGAIINRMIDIGQAALRESIRNNTAIAMNGLFFDKEGKEREVLTGPIEKKRLLYKKLIGYGSDYKKDERVPPSVYFHELATNPLKKELWPHIDINQSLAGSPHGDTALMHAVRTGDKDTIRAILSLPPELQPDLNKMNDKGETAALLAAQRGDVGALRLLMGTVVIGPDGEPRLQHAPEAPENMKKTGNLTNRNMVFQNGEDLLMQAQRWASLNNGDVKEDAMRNVDGTPVKKVEGVAPNTAIVEQMIAEMGFERPDWKPEKTVSAAVDVDMRPDNALLNPRMSDAALRDPVDKDDLRRLAKNFAEHSSQLIVNIDKIRNEVANMEPGHDQDVAYKAADDLRQTLFDNVARAKPEVVIAAFQIAVHKENYKTANLLLETIKNAIEGRPSVSNPWAEAVLPVDWSDPNFYEKSKKNPSKYLSPLQTSIIDLTTIKTSSASPEREEEIAELEKRMEFLQHATMGQNGYILQDVHAKTHDPKVAAQIEEQLRAWERESAPKPS